MDTGEGTFGIVLLAKAEGIVKETPKRNIVAVKTHKGMYVVMFRQLSIDSKEIMCIHQHVHACTIFILHMYMHFKLLVHI